VPILVTDLRDSFELSLRGPGKAERTVEVYLLSLNTFAKFLTESGHSGMVEDVTSADLNRWAEAIRAGGAAPATVSIRWRSLRQFFKWAHREDEISRDPIEGLPAPKVVINPVPVLSDDQIGRLLKTCSGRDFAAVRDTAIIRLLLDTGIRRAEIAGLTLTDVDLRERSVTVLGKGSRLRTVRFGHKTAHALDRYLRTRARVPKVAGVNALWLGERQALPLAAEGIRQMMRRRGTESGIEGLHPHQMRHTYASDYLASGGNESDLMRQAGWRSRQMLDRYGASVADERARDNRDRLTLKGDRL
jgi:integrase/recombinase XerC